ncbi:MAG: AAA family ATPase [Deltaproteobacteria bacterium]|nr:AAA family ATPase [Deltaproteobacteria bacterium]
MNLRLSPSIVWFDKALSRIESERARFRTIFVRGKPLSGKSTLLQQIAIKLRASAQPVTTISFSDSLDLSSALEQILLTLDTKPTSRSLPELFEQLVQLCDREHRILIIDNLHKVRNAKQFIEFVIRNMTDGTLIASGDTLPDLDPSLALDLFVFHNVGLSFEETVEMISKSHVKLPSSADKMIENIFKMTAGNPFLIKLLLSPAILEGRALSEEDFQANILNARDSYFYKIFQSLSVEVSDLLKTASLVQYDSALESKVLSRVSKEDLQQLLEVGFLTMSFDRYALIADTKRFIRKTLGDLEKEQIHILLKEFSENEAHLSEKEKLFQFIKLEQEKEAIQIFEKIAPEMDRTGDTIDLLYLSETFSSQLSCASILLRRKSLVYLKRPHEALEELKKALKRDFSEEEKFQLYFMIAKTLYLLSEFEEALRYIHLILEKTHEHDLNHIHAQIEKAYMLLQRDLKSCIENLETARRSINLKHLDQSTLRGDLEFVYGLYYEARSELAEAAYHYSSATNFYKSSGLKSKELMSAYNTFCMNYNLGRETSLEALDSIEAECRRYSFEYIIEFCKHFRAMTLISAGRFREGIKILIAMTPPLTEKIFHSNEISILKRIAQAYCGSSHFLAAMAVLEPLTINPGSYGQFFEHMKSQVSAYLNPALAQPKKSILKKNYESLDKKLVVELLTTHLELNFNSYFLHDVSDVLLASEFNESDTDSILHLQLKFLRGIHFFLMGQIKRAEQEFYISLPLAEKYSFHYWEFLNLLGLSMADLHFERFDAALSKSTKAVDLISLFDPLPITDLAKAILGIAHLKLGAQSNFEKQMTSIPSTSPYAYLGLILSPFLLESKPPATPSIDSAQKSFFDLLLTRLGLNIFRTFRVKTMNSENIYYDYQLNEFSMNNYDIVIDETKAKCRIGKKSFDLNSQPLLENILRFFILRAGKETSKELLTSHIWQEKYNPLVHDTRIYTAIKRLRELLKQGSKESLLQTQGSQYLMDSKIRYAIISMSTPLDNLSERQDWIFKFIESHQSIDRLTVEKMLKISPAYAKRELKTLSDRGLIEKVGKGKNSRYQKASRF